MGSTDRSLVTGGSTGITRDVTSRKRKQAIEAEVDPLSPARHGSRFKFTMPGSSSSVSTGWQTGITGVEPGPLAFLGGFLSQDRPANTSSAELGSVNRSDTCREGDFQDRSSGGAPLTSSPLTSSPEAVRYGHFRPFSSSSPGREASVPEAGLCQDSVPAGVKAKWLRKREWDREGIRIGSGNGGASESVNRSSGTSGITKQGDASIDQALTGIETKRRLSSDWNSISIAGGGSVSGITRDTGSTRPRSPLSSNEEDADGTSQEEADTEAPGSRRTPPSDLDGGRRSEAHGHASESALLGKDKRGRGRSPDVEERRLKCVRLVGSFGHVGSPSPNSVLQPEGDECSSPGTGAPGVPRVPLEDLTDRLASEQPQGKNGALLTLPGGKAEHEVGGCDDPREGQPLAEHLSSIRERMSDSIADMESSGRLSGYEPETSLSDVPDGDGALFILSSGRSRRRQGAVRSSRQPTIDDEFEQYFSQMLL